jgi:hypothetical protein
MSGFTEPELRLRVPNGVGCAAERHGECIGCE